MARVSKNYHDDGWRRRRRQKQFTSTRQHRNNNNSNACTYHDKQVGRSRVQHGDLEIADRVLEVGATAHHFGRARDECRAGGKGHVDFAKARVERQCYYF